MTFLNFLLIAFGVVALVAIGVGVWTGNRQLISGVVIVISTTAVVLGGFCLTATTQ